MMVAFSDLQGLFRAFNDLVHTYSLLMNGEQHRADEGEASSPNRYNYQFILGSHR
jgi:hypothetical protein